MKRHAAILTATSLAGLAVAAPAAAQEAFALDEITVFANRAPTALDRTGTSVSVISSEDLDTAGDVQLADYLQRLPGVTASQQGPEGSAANLRIRGADRRYIAVYVDGVRVDDPSLVQTGTDFGALSTADIGRVELLRGSQSALYGGSAVGGVINITTRQAESSGTSQRARAEAGSFGTVRGSYTFTRRGEDGVASVSISGARSDGFSAADENAGNTEADGYDSKRLSFRISHDVSETLTIGASGFYQDSTVEYDGVNASGAIADLDNIQDRREAGGRVHAAWDLGRTTHRVEASGYRITRVNDEQGVFTPGRSVARYRGTRFGLSYQGETRITPDFTLLYGAETMQERARYANLSGGARSTRVNGIFAQALWAATPQLDVSASGRIDDNSDFGTYPTGRVAVAYRPDESWTLRASAATGFRAPSLDERFGVYGSFTGNPALDAEESTSFELGAEKRFAGGATLGATAFRVAVDNLIQSNATFTSLVNVPGKSTRQGLELSGEMPLNERFTLGAAYTYTDTESASGGRLRQVPRHDLTLTLDAQLAERLSGLVSLRHVAGRPRDGFPARNMPDYTVLSANFTYEISESLDATLRLENILDEQYQTVAGYGTSDRAVYLGVSSRF